MRVFRQRFVSIAFALVSCISHLTCLATGQAVAAADQEVPQETSPEDQDAVTKKTTVEESTQQTHPLVDLFGQQLLKLNKVNATTASIQAHSTTEALENKNVIGVYFSADWCPSCVKFTPELVRFHEKVNKRRNGDFAVVWVSQCRDVNAYTQYFTHMGDFFALPPEEAMGARGGKLSKLYGVKGIPSLVLLDESGSVITRDARAKIPQDRAGIGFPWRNPLVTMYMTLVPRRLRSKIKDQIGIAKQKVQAKAKQIFQIKRKAKPQAAIK